MAKRNSTRKKLPSLVYAGSTGWWFSWLKDPSKPMGRTRHYWSKDEAEAQRLYRETIEKAVAEAGERRPDTVTRAAVTWTLVDTAEAYHADRKADGVSVATLGQIKKYVPMFFRWLLKRGFDPAVRRPDELTTSLLAGYRKTLADDRKIGRTEANHRIGYVRGLLNWARETHELPTPPLGAIRKIPLKAKRGHGTTFTKVALTWEQINALVKVADPVDLCVLLLGLNVGFGPTDIGELRFGAVDLDAARLTDTRPKTGITRDFALWPETVTALRAYLAEHRGEPSSEELADRFFIGRQGNPLCWERIGDDGKRIRGDAVHNRWDKLVERAGLDLPKGSGAYCLRHTYATLIGGLSTDPREVQAALAHATMRQQETYRHDRRSKAQAAQNRLGEQFSQHVRLPMH